MFEGSEHHDHGYFPPLQRAGGLLNGSTNVDRTNYWEVVPTGALDLALWMESDRMGYLLARAHRAEVRQPARRRAERAAAELREPAVRAGRHRAVVGDVPAGSSVSLADDRIGRGPPRRVARSGARVLPDLLPPRQRVAVAGG